MISLQAAASRLTTAHYPAPRKRTACGLRATVFCPARATGNILALARRDDQPPTDAVHRRNSPPGIRVVHAFQRALELAARELQMQDKRVRHGQHSSAIGVAVIRRTHNGTRQWGQEPDRTGDTLDPLILRQVSRLIDGFKLETPATHDRNSGKACWTSGARLCFGRRHGPAEVRLCAAPVRLRWLVRRG